MQLSDPVLLAIIASCTTVITSSLALLIAVLNRSKIEAIHIATNSMKDALVIKTRTEALQEGHKAGVEEQKSADNVHERKED